MKNLKKVLSLVLALAMALSLMTVAFAADAGDYADYDEVTNKEAVDVMTAIGVFDGMGGSFNPDGNLTREQAAKIITYMIMGKEEADELTTVIAPYSDVSADRWSAGAIAYCTNEGIISGMGNNKFAPTANVTGLQFAKMLLVALGYDPDIEKFTGDSWAINVSKQAIGIGLSQDVGVSLSQPLTREQAAQMAFNAEQADMVDYDNRGTEITLPGLGTIITGASNAETVAQGNYDNNLKTAGLQFAEKYCQDLKKVEAADDFGRPATTWKMKNATINTYADDATVTYTAEVETGTIYSDLGLSSKITATVTRNGDPAADLLISKGNVAKTGTGEGTRVEVFYDSDANTIQIVEIDTYVAQVSTVKPATSKDERSIVLTDKSSAAPTNFNSHNTFETTAFAEDDIVLYTYADDEIQSVVLAEQATGDLTGRTQGKSVTVGGTTYKYSAMANASDLDSITVKSDVVLYLDASGNVIWGEISKEAASNYAYILYRGGDGWGTTQYANLLLTDGTVAKKVELASSSVGTAGDIVNYSVNDKGVYTLYAVSPNADKSHDTLATTPGTAWTNFKLVKGQAGIDFNSTNATLNVYANDKTVFVVATGDHSDPTFTAYKGIANVPSISGTTGIAYYCKTANMLTFAVIDATSGSVETDSNTVIFVDASSKSNLSINSDGEQYYTYDAVVNGEVTKLNVLKTVADSQLSTDQLFTGVTYNTNGIAKAFSTNNDIVNENVSGVNKVDGNAIKLASTYYSLASDVQVFYVDPDDGLVTYSTGAIQTAAGDKAYFIYKDGEIKTLVIVSGAAATSPEGPGANANITSFTVTPVSGTATVNVTGTGFDSNSKVSYQVDMLQNGKYVTVGTFQAAYSSATQLTGSFPVVAGTYYQVTLNGSVQVILGA